MLKDEIIPKQVVSGIQIETFGDGVLLYKEAVREAAYLNNTAAVIWAMCDGNNTVADIEKTLIKAYPEGKDSIRKEINFTLENLQKKDAIEF
jgi:hypothetical protein